MINENILTELKQLKQSIEEVSVYDLNVYSSMELYSRVAGKINELIKEVMTYQGLLSEELLKELDYINNHLDTFLYEIRTNSEMAINDMNIAKDEMIEQVTNKINENQLLINSLLNYSNRLSYLERMLDLLFSENVSHRTKLLLEGNHLSLTNSKEGLIQINSTGGNTLVNLYKKTWKAGFTSIYELTVGKKYTFISNFISEVNGTYVIETNKTWSEYARFDLKEGNNFIKAVFTIDDKFNKTEGFNIAGRGVNNSIEHINSILIEGDYTNKPIPDYFTGMQSSFEDKLVTQEMVDSGKELAENLGKYRVDYKVTGKNKFDGKLEVGSLDDVGINMSNNTYRRSLNHVPVIPNTRYEFRVNDEKGYGRMFFYDKNKTFISSTINNQNDILITPVNCHYIRFRIDMLAYLSEHPMDESTVKYQLEEGSTATPYEPYKESIKTYYLNSPLLEGDTIEEKNGNVYHVHRWKQINDFSSFTISKGATPSYQRYHLVLKEKAYPEKETLKNIISNKFKNDIDSENSIFKYATGEEMVFLVSPTISTVSDFRQYLIDNNVVIAYKLASPQYELISENDDLIMKCFNGCSIDYDSIIPVEITDVTFTGEGTSSTNLLVDDVDLENDEITREV